MLFIHLQNLCNAYIGLPGEIGSYRPIKLYLPYLFSNKLTTEPYQFFLFKFDSYRVFDDNFFQLFGTS